MFQIGPPQPEAAGVRGAEGEGEHRQPEPRRAKVMMILVALLVAVYRTRYHVA